MPRLHLLSAVLLASCASAASPASSASSDPPRPAAAHPPPFDVAQLRADIRFLASDLLEGPRAGTRGHDIAPDLAATTVELSDPKLAAAIRVPDSALVSADFAHTELDLSGPMTFVGKGVCDADSGRDDAAGVDLKGRFAV